MEYFFPPALVLFFVVFPLLIGVCAALGGRRWGWKVIAVGAGIVLLPCAATVFLAPSIGDGIKLGAIFGVAMGFAFFVGFFLTMLVQGRRSPNVPRDR